MTTVATQRNGAATALALDPHDGVWQMTPSIAEKWITERGAENVRKVDGRHVTELARAITEGRWELTNASIGFDMEGRLVDGQHRLLAIVEAGMTVPLRVVTGLKPGAERYIDIGSTRTAGVTFSLNGYAHATLTAGVVRLLYARHVGIISAKPSAGTLVDFANTLPTLRETVELASHFYCIQDVKALRNTAIGFFLMTHAGCEGVDTFLERATTGTGLEDGDPALALRRRQLRAVQRSVGRSGKWHRREAIAVEIQAICMAFEAFASNVPMQRLTVREASLLKLAGLDYRYPK